MTASSCCKHHSLFQTEMGIRFICPRPGHGTVVLSDLGHTMMHISYEHDVDAFYKGAREVQREIIVNQAGIDETDGIFSIEVEPDKIVDALFTLGQALTRIYNLTTLSRERVNSTFDKELEEMLQTIIEKRYIEMNYKPLQGADADNYMVDYRIQMPNDDQVFLYGVPNQHRARLATISLYEFRHRSVNFVSVIVYENQQELPRGDVARLTNVADTAIASLAANDDLVRKLKRWVG